MMAHDEHRDGKKPNGDAADEDERARLDVRTARAGDQRNNKCSGRDAGQRHRKSAPRAEIGRRKDRIDAAEPQKCRQMQAADHAACDEQRERDQHAAGAAARGVERAGAAAVRELHADAEHEGADDQRWSDRRDRAAKAGH